MQDIVRSKLAELVGRFGLDLCNDARRCEALLRDVCNEHKREITALVSAAREGVGNELRQSSAGVPKELIVARLTNRLHENVGLAEDLARWAVESWAVALGVATAKEFRFPFRCPKCGAQDSIPSKLAGKKTICPKCSAILFIADNGREIFLVPDSQELSHKALPAAASTAGRKSEVPKKPTPASVASTAKTPTPADLLQGRLLAEAIAFANAHRSQGSSPVIGRPSPVVLPSVAEMSRTANTSPAKLQPFVDVEKVAPTIVLDKMTGQELRTYERVAQLFQPLCERTTLGEDTIRKVRSHLTAWADNIPHHKFRDFGMLLQIRQALCLPNYSIVLKTQYETRTVKRAEVLYTGAYYRRPKSPNPTSKYGRIHGRLLRTLELARRSIRLTTLKR